MNSLGLGIPLNFINKKQTILLRNWQRWTEFFHMQVVMNIPEPDPG
jgi:hypothetical protein